MNIDKQEAIRLMVEKMIQADKICCITVTQAGVNDRVEYQYLSMNEKELFSMVEHRRMLVKELQLCDDIIKQAQEIIKN